MTKKILKVLEGETIFPPPIWLMRQAGRYLPEYRQLRAKADNFLQFCQNPVLATEATLQPLHRFQFDAAILFSDILVVPHALGRDLHFETGSGPIMSPLAKKDIQKLRISGALDRLSPALETIQRVKKELDPSVALIGFCGAPWTVATYMIAGQATSDQAAAKLFFLKNPEFMQQLIEILTDISAQYLIAQIDAGADLVQIFDSWSGVLDEEAFEILSINPILEITKKIKTIYPHIPIIAFPKGAGYFYENYVEKTKVTALGLDWTVPLSVAKKLQKQHPVQGNLDPLRLVAGGQALETSLEAILEQLGSGPLIINLGHGIVPQTPIENVEKMIEIIRQKDK